MSFSLKVILVLHSGPWKFWKFENGPFPLPPAPLLCLAAVCSAAPPTDAVESQPGPSCFALAPTRHAAPPSPPLASRWSSPAVPRAPAERRAARAAATLSPRWQAHCRGRRPPLARARALQEPQHSILLALSLAPQSHATERAAAPPRTPASSSHRRTHSSALPRPATRSASPSCS